MNRDPASLKRRRLLQGIMGLAAASWLSPAVTLPQAIRTRPFRHGDLFGYVRGKPLPTWAGEFDCTNWAQFFLKFIVSHPAVTVAIPATTRVDHMQENMGAGVGRLPEPAMRQRMIHYMEAL